MAGQEGQAGTGRGRGQGRAHGTPDLDYDLISAIYHNLQGAEASGLYANDAVEEGDEAIAQFFREAQQGYLRQADRAKQLLAERMGRAGRTDG